MEVRVHSQELIPSLSCRDWRMETGCLNLTMLHALRKCELTLHTLTTIQSCSHTQTECLFGHVRTHYHIMLSQLYSVFLVVYIVMQ